MRVWSAFALLALLAIAAPALCQDDCSAQVDQVKSQLGECHEQVRILTNNHQNAEASLSQKQQELAEVQADLAAAKAQVTEADTRLAAAQEEVRTLQSSSQDCSQQAQQDKTEIQAKAIELAQAQADLAAAQAKVTEAENKAAAAQQLVRSKASEVSQLKSEVQALRKDLAESKAAPVDFATAVKTLTAGARQGLQAAASEAQAIYEEAKAGKADRLTAVAGDALSAVRGAASSAYKVVVVAVDENVPEHVKAQVRENIAKASTAWRTNVVEAQWAKPVVSQLSAANEELKTLVSTTMSKSPALAPYVDPVVVQIVVYSIFGLPLLLLVVLPFALCGSCKPKTEAVTKKAGGKKKGASKARA